MNYINIFLSFVILLIVLIFLLRSKLIGLISSGLRVGFFMFIIIALSSIFAPIIYNKTADLILRQTGTYQSIKSIDETLLTNYLNSDEDLFDMFKDFFGNEDKKEIKEEEKGYFEEKIYDNLVKLFSMILRIFTFVLSLSFLIVTIYLSYSASSSLEINDLRNEQKSLQKRIEELERLVNKQVAIEI